MSQLAKIQAEFRRHITEGDNEIVRSIQDGGHITPKQRVSIYENAYFARLTEALATDYKVLFLVLGDEEFYALSKAYILAKPSHYFSLRWFGKHFAQFLSEQEGEHATMLAQLARLEWAFVDAFVSADTPMLALQKIAKVSLDAWPTMRFYFHPSLQIIEHDWDILSYWRAGRDEQPFAEPTFYENNQKILVWRRELTTQYRSLTINEAYALEAAMLNLNFSQICETVLAHNTENNELAAAVIGWLQVWLAEGLICDIEHL